MDSLSLPAALEAKMLEALDTGEDCLPSLPEVAVEAMRLSQGTNVDFEKIVNVIERDPSLAARLLAIANSPLYLGALRITSLRGALVRVGLETTRELLHTAALAAALLHRARDPEQVLAVFRHSVGVARCAAHLAHRTRVDAEAAFVGGLLHDTGRVLCLRVGERFRDASPAEMEAAVDALHGQAGAMLARSWGLSEEIALACLEHDKLDTEHAIARVVAVSNVLMHHVEPASRVTDDDVLAALSVLHVSEAHAEEIKAFAEQAHRAAASAF